MILGENYEYIFIFKYYIYRRNIRCGTIVLTAAVESILITAPIGALLIDSYYKKLLEGDTSEGLVC